MNSNLCSVLLLTSQAAHSAATAVSIWPGRHAVPRASDNDYDYLGQRGHYRQSQITAGLIFNSFLSNGRDVKLFQGCFMRANDLHFLKEIGIGLVVNVTFNIEAPPWIGFLDDPRWWRFAIPQLHRDAQVLLAFETFYQFVPNAPWTATMSSSIVAQGPIAQAHARPFGQ